MSVLRGGFTGTRPRGSSGWDAGTEAWERPSDSSGGGDGGAVGASPNDAGEIVRALHVSVGLELACAVLDDRMGARWGAGEHGQPGDAIVGPSNHASRPVSSRESPGWSRQAVPRSVGGKVASAGWGTALAVEGARRSPAPSSHSSTPSAWSPIKTGVVRCSRAGPRSVGASTSSVTSVSSSCVLAVRTGSDTDPRAARLDRRGCLWRHLPPRSRSRRTSRAAE
jgi:hypothetical protein